VDDTGLYLNIIMVMPQHTPKYSQIRHFLACSLLTKQE